MIPIHYLIVDEFQWKLFFNIIIKESATFTWSDVPQKTSSCSGQGHGSPEEDGQDEVGEQSREPDHLGKDMIKF